MTPRALRALFKGIVLSRHICIQIQRSPAVVTLARAQNIVHDGSTCDLVLLHLRGYEGASGPSAKSLHVLPAPVASRGVMSLAGPGPNDRAGIDPGIGRKAWGEGQRQKLRPEQPYR